MKFLIPYIRKFWPIILVALALALVNKIAAFCEPYVFKLIIDDYLRKSSVDSLKNSIQSVVILIVIAFGLTTISRLASHIGHYFTVKLAKTIGRNLYKDSLTHCLKLPYNYFENNRSGEILVKLQSAKVNIELFITELICSQFALFISLAFIVIYSYHVYWVIAPVVLAVIPLIGYFSNSINGKLKYIQKRFFEETNTLAGTAFESIKNIHFIKSMGLVTQEVGKLEFIFNRILKLDLMKTLKLNSILFFQNSLINIFRNALLLWFLFLVINETITIGDFFSLLMYSYLILQPLQQVSSMANVYRESKISIRFLDELFKLPLEKKGIGKDEIHAFDKIEFNDVSFNYGKSLFGVSNISFTVNKGETLAVVGTSGCGKSTVMKLLLGLYKPVEGHILVDDKRVDQLDIDSLRKHIGYVTQDHHFFSGSIRDNLRCVKLEATDQEVIRCMEVAECEYLIRRSAEGLDTLIGEGGIKLSGGEKQRLAIARALLRNPELLVFDEATSSLDATTEEKIFTMIRGIVCTSKFISVIISHRLPMVSFADKIVVIDKGRIVEAGNHNTLLLNNGHYTKMWFSYEKERHTVEGHTDVEINADA